MKEIFEFRIDKKYFHYLFENKEGKDDGNYILIRLENTDPRFNQVGILNEEIKKKFKDLFFLGWRIKRIYSQGELEYSKLFHMIIKTTFEPFGEECGTIYDDSAACELCGANSVQLNELHLKKSAIPKKDIAWTIAGEVVVSEKFKNAIEKWELKGIFLASILTGKKVINHYQLKALSTKIELAKETIAGCNPFDFREYSDGSIIYIPGGHSYYMEKEYYKCPKGHTIGLNLLSLPYVLNSEDLYKYDFFATRQMIGVRRGVLRPEPIYLCSPKFRQMVIEEKLTGFKFDIANIVEKE